MSDQIINPFPYFGGKKAFLDFLYQYLPYQKKGSFLESHCGCAVVTLNRPVTMQEHLNDKSKRIVAFFECLRDQTKLDALIEKIRYTPYAEDEFEACLQNPDDMDDIVELARRFIVVNNQSIGAMGHAGSGWSIKYTHSGEMRSGVTGFQSDALEFKWRRTAERMRNSVHVHNKDAVEFIEKYSHKDAILYCDPPYIGHDISYAEKTDHNALADVLHRFEGRAFISGYRSNAMDLLYSDWHRVDNHPQRTQVGNFKLYGEQPLRVESLWMNRPPIVQQPDMFADM